MSTGLHRVPPNAVLLVGLLGLILISPNVRASGAEVIIELIFDLILLAAVYAAKSSKHRWPFGLLTALTLAIRWRDILGGTTEYEVLYSVFTVLWLPYATWIIVSQLFQRRDVTLDTILAAVNAYLLIAVGFMELYALVELQSPGSFTALGEAANPDRQKMSGTMLYLSLVSLTTMGYGDIVPVSNVARPLAALEGVIGQLYLAVLIARLVGLHISRREGDRG